MKKYIIIVCLLLCGTLSAQDIRFKKIESDGHIIIASQPFTVSSPWQPTVEYSLLFISNDYTATKLSDGDVFLLLSVSVAKDNLLFEKGSKLLIKTGSDEVFNVVSELGRESIRLYDSEGYYTYILQSVRSGAKTKYNIQYTIGEDVLHAVTTSGIHSLRIQTSANNIDCEHTPEMTKSVQAYFQKAIITIEDSLNPRQSF